MPLTETLPSGEASYAPFRVSEIAISLANFDRYEVAHASPRSCVGGHDQLEVSERSTILLISHQHLLAFEVRIEFADGQGDTIPVSATGMERVLKVRAWTVLINKARSVQECPQECARKAACLHPFGASMRHLYRHGRHSVQFAQPDRARVSKPPLQCQFDLRWCGIRTISLCTHVGRDEQKAGHAKGQEQSAASRPLRHGSTSQPSRRRP